MEGVRIPIDRDRVADFCRRWRIREFSLFGSVLRDDFRPDSDVDILVTFDPDAPWTLWDHMDLQDELSDWLGRKVDLVSKRALKNPFRRREILTTRKIIHGG